MGKKTKSKQRLDKFYNLAKEQGYRSRAAFKLIQLNRKYNLLEGCNVVIDLCAAPGGWLQVASQMMPLSSTIIGLDLVSIKGIPGCKTFQQDITSPACFQLLTNELNGKQADLVLHDGAPNVGAAWNKDAYNQNELVLSSLKLATSFLKRGGTFVTKVFRSTDYNSLLWVFNKFFDKVEATKPIASRNVSAEIFVVCLGFIAPKFIDEKLFSVNHVFKETEADLATTQRQLEITSVQKLFEKRRNRTGYAEDGPLTVYKEIKFQEFLYSENPYPIFLEYNKIYMTEEEKIKYTALAKPPNDLDEIFSDIKVLGKREVLQLIKWRGKLKHKLGEQRRKEKQSNNEGKEIVDEDIQDDQQVQEQEWDTDNDNNNNEYDDDVQVQEDNKDFQNIIEKDNNNDDDDVYEDLVEMQMDLIDKENKQNQEQEIKEQRRKREKQLKLEKKRMASGGGDVGIDSDQELFNLKKHSKKLKNAQFIDMNEVQQNKANDNINQLTYANEKELNQTLEEMYERKQTRKIESQIRIKDIVKQKKDKHRKDLKVDYDSDQMACEPKKKKKTLLNKEEKTQLKQTLNKKFFDREIFSELKQQVIGTEQKDNNFQNPLKNIKLPKGNEVLNEGKPQKQQLLDNKLDIFDSDNEEQPNPNLLSKLQRQVQFDLDGLNQDNNRISQEPFPDEESKIKLYELNVPISEMEKRRRRLKKEKSRDLKQKADPKGYEDPNKGDIEIVPRKTLDNYHIDDLAYNRALAQKMFRKGIRDDILERSFSRHALDDDADLPKWFVDDEQRHQYKIEPITKEEFNAEKERLYAINSKVPKKVMEFKIRRWKKAQKKSRKAAQKAQQIFDQDGINEMVKMKQVRKIYRKEAEQDKKDKDKKYIVSKKGRPIKGGNSASVKMVDKRMKKDKRGEKMRTKKIRKIGHGKKRRQVNRHKGKKQKS